MAMPLVVVHYFFVAATVYLTVVVAELCYHLPHQQDKVVIFL
jgi:hypothetical protein